MLSQNSLINAYSFAQTLSDEGKRLAPKPNTMLATLCGHSIPLTPIASNKEQNSYDQFKYVGAEIERFTTGAIVNDLNALPTNHSAEMDAYISDLQKLVTAHVSFAKNTVKPEVVAFSEALLDYRQNVKPEDVNSKFNIIQVDVPAPLRDEGFFDTFTRYQGKSILPPDVTFKLTSIQTEDILTRFLTGSDRFDRLVMEWLSTQEESFIRRIWSNFFEGSTDSRDESYLTFENVSAMNPYDRLSTALAIYLFAIKLKSNVESNTGMDLRAYNAAADQYMDYAGAIVTSTIKIISGFRASKTLIIENNSISYNIKVDALTYKTWLEAGNCPEILLGLMVSGDRITLAAAITEKAEAFKSAYNSYLTFHGAKEANQMNDRYRLALRQMFQTALQEKNAEIDSYREKKPEYLDVARKLGDEYIDSLKISDFDKIHDIALALIAGCKYYYSSACEILTSMVEAARVNPNIEPREAATFAVVLYLAKHLACQMTIKQ